MKEKTVLKIIVDVVMTVLYLFLMFSFGTGAFFHEAAGIITGLLFILHFALNLDFFKGLLNLFKKNHMKIDKKLLLFLDYLLLICMPFVLITGLLIAKEIYLLDWSLDFLLIFKIHKILSYVCLGILALHLGLHTKYLLAIFKQIRKKNNKKVVLKVMSRCSAAIAATFFIYMLAYNTYLKGKELSKLPVSEDTTAEQSSNEVTSSVYASDEEAITSISPSENNSSETTEKTVAQTTAAATKKDEDDSASQTTQSDTTASPSLNDFLGKMFCTGCHRHCVLTNPQCSRGVAQAEQAEVEYVQEYGTSN